MADGHRLGKAADHCRLRHGTVTASTGPDKAVNDCAYDALLDAALAFTLTDSGTPVVGVSWTDLQIPAEPGLMWMGARFEGSPSPFGLLKIEHEEIAWAGRYLKTDGQLRRWVDVALDRSRGLEICTRGRAHHQASRCPLDFATWELIGGRPTTKVIDRHCVVKTAASSRRSPHPISARHRSLVFRLPSRWRRFLHLQSVRGVIVTDVDETGAAKPGGIQAGDVIMRMDGKEIVELRDLPRIVAETPADKAVEIVIIRAGVEKSINVTLGPGIPPRTR